MADIQTIDAATGQVKAVSADAADEGFRTGALRLPDGTDVPLVGPDGKTSPFPAANVADAIANGFRFAGGRDQARMRAEETPVLAFAEGLANDLVPIPGAVHLLELAMGVDKDDIAARAETTSGRVGQGLGIGASLLTGGVMVRGGKAALGHLLPGVAANTAGRALTEGAEKAIGGYVEGEIARKALSAGLGRAVEGATYGVASVLDEAALGNVELNTETLLASAGAGALIGGALGTAVKGATEGVKRGVRNYVKEDITAKLAGSLVGHMATGGIGGRAAGRVIGERVGSLIARSEGGPALQSLKALLEKSDEWIGRRLEKLAGISAPQFRPPVEAFVTRSTLAMMEGKDADRRDAYDARVREIGALANDPALYARGAERELGDIAGDAPNHAYAVSAYGQKLLQYLAKNVPPAKPGSGGGPSALFSAAKRKERESAGRPDDRAIREFAELDRIVQAPNTILDRIEDGTVRASHVAALKELYPGLHARIENGLLTNLPYSESEISKDTRRGITTFLAKAPTASIFNARQSVFDPVPPPEGQGSAAPSVTAPAPQTLTQSQTLELT